MKTTLWKLLESYNVVIPIIQRDYAQGRSGREYLRKKILEQIGKALNVIPNESPEDSDKSDDMDFVYGTVAGDNFYPLDGQQRLTTLWLLYWYVAYRAGKLGDENAKERLKKFSYETRTSSREFCEKLCDFAPNSDASDLTVDSIQQQTWFYSAWKQDPTIQAMLRMLSGTKALDEKKNDFIDGIEELFKDILPNNNYSALWANLTQPDCPLTFSILPIGTEELPISDTLYVKMNARGEQLTAFENFKADLINWVCQNQGFDASIELAGKIDNAWTDIFWEKRLQLPDAEVRIPSAFEKKWANRVDEIFFAFINRFWLNHIITITIKDDDGSYPSISEEELQNTPYYCQEFRYDSFDYYEHMKSKHKDKSGQCLMQNCQVELAIKRLYSILDNYPKIKEFEPEKGFLYSPWLDADDSKSEKSFIPGYDDTIVDVNDNNPIKAISQPQRVVFFAICKFLAEIPPVPPHDLGTRLKRWLRVVWNLVSVETEDGRLVIRTIDEMRKTIRIIDKLDSLNIYEFLLRICKLDNDEWKSFGQESLLMLQLQEEIEKAKKILFDEPSWEGVIAA